MSLPVLIYYRWRLWRLRRRYVRLLGELERTHEALIRVGAKVRAASP